MVLHAAAAEPMLWKDAKQAKDEKKKKSSATVKRKKKVFESFSGQFPRAHFAFLSVSWFGLCIDMPLNVDVCGFGFKTKKKIYALISLPDATINE